MISFVSTPISVNGCLNKCCANELLSITVAAASSVATLIVVKLDNSLITNLSSSFAIVAATTYSELSSFAHCAFVYPLKNPSSTTLGQSASSNNVLKITVLVSSLAFTNVSFTAFNVARGTSFSSCVPILLISNTNSPSCSTAIVLATLTSPSSSSLQLVISSILTPISVKGCFNKLCASVLSSATVAATSNVATLIVVKLDNSSIFNFPSSFAIVDATLYKAFNSVPHVAFVHVSKNPSSTKDGVNAVSNNVLTITVLVFSSASAKISFTAANVESGIDSLNCDSRLSK